MGYNSTVVVMNDAMTAIEKDPEFGKKLVQAILSQHGKNVPVDISSGGHVNAATVIDCHHSDYSSLILVGGNMGTVLVSDASGYKHDAFDQFDACSALAKKLGYKLTKKK